VKGKMKVDCESYVVESPLGFPISFHVALKSESPGAFASLKSAGFGFQPVRCEPQRN
jgi:hypothetical protein